MLELLEYYFLKTLYGKKIESFYFQAFIKLHFPIFINYLVEKVNLLYKILCSKILHSIQMYDNSILFINSISNEICTFVFRY